MTAPVWATASFRRTAPCMGGTHMAIISWIILGLIAGFIASKLVDKQGQGLGHKIPDPFRSSRFSSACRGGWRRHVRIPVRLTQLLLLSVASLGPALAYAALSAHLQRGEKIVDLPVPGRSAEVCVIPKHFDGGRYFANDIEVETQLCNIDVHTNAAVCAKLNSTNPGLDIHSLPQGSTPNRSKPRIARLPAQKRSPNTS